MEWYSLLILIFLGLTFFMLVGIPIVYSLGVTTIIVCIFLAGPKVFFLFATIAYGKIDEFALVAVPLFIFMAEIIIYSDVAKRAFKALNEWIGSAPGGLAIASQVLCTMFAAVSGASTATTAVIGGIAVPEMLERGYDKRMATGSIAAGGALGVLIPPSILLIVYGMLTETSIGQLFLAGIIPGLMLSGMRVLYFLIICTLNPKLGPRSPKTSWNKKFISLIEISPLTILIIFLFGALYTGACTPTELAGIGAFSAILIALFYKKLTFSRLKNALNATTHTTCFIMWILVAASAFGYLLSYVGLPQKLCDWAVDLPISKWWIIFAINLLLIFLGCIMDPGGIIMVTTPILAPLVQSLGFDLVWFGIMVVVNIELAEITPPLGLNLYIMKAVSPASVTLNDIILGAIPFMILDIVGLFFIILFPSLVLWLPSKLI